MHRATFLTRGLPSALLMLVSTTVLANDKLLVTVTDDAFDGLCDVHCSLRDAVETANRTPGTDHILLPAGEYVLDLPAPEDERGVPYDEDDNLNGDLDVRDELVIQGRGDQRSRILGGNDRLFEVLPDAQLTLLRLGLEQGNTAYNGGAVENHGQLLLRQVRVQGNKASTQNPTLTPLPPEDGYRFGQGGGIANYGTLEIYASSFQENRSEGFYWDNNLGRGGAIFNQGGNLLVRDSVFERNLVTDQADNGSGGAIYNGGQADIARSLFVANSGAEQSRGGAIANEAGGVLKLTNSTFSGNYSGALSNGYPANPEDALPSATLINVTITRSLGYGLYNWGDLRIRNSLIAGNLDPYEEGVALDCRNVGVFRYRAIGLLLSSQTSNCNADLYIDVGQTFTHLLEPLADNGGLSRTHALRPGGLAIDSGIGSCTTHDQRRLPRPQDGNGDGVAVCDLGAYERQP